MITIQNVSKSFKDVKAVKMVSFDVNDGELFGLIGPDGAGKTTLLRLINSLIVPTEGDISLWGLNTVADYKQIRSIIGYMPGKFSLYLDMTVEENLNFFATVFGTTVAENYHLIKDIYSHIEPFKTRKASQLSGGMKQKLALSCALIHKPKLLILDEPTTGVDAVSRGEFWEMLLRLKQNGITIIVSTPYMDEAMLCDRIALMQAGSILNVNTPIEITKEFTKPLYAIDTDQKYLALKILKQWPETASVYPYGNSLHFTHKDNHFNLDDLKQRLSNNSVGFNHIEQIQPGIEDCFMELMENRIN